MIDSLNQGLAHGLYHLSSALLLPVMATVACLLVAVSLAAGGLLREWSERPRIRRGLREVARTVIRSRTEATEIWSAFHAIAVGLPSRFHCGEGSLPDAAGLQSLLAELENDVAARLARLQFVTRIGPMLGLLGTLIPFGPALAGLAGGDVRELSANLVTAFATTVVGLLCGCVGFGMGIVRKTWYSRDFDEIELIVRFLTARILDDAPQATAVGRRE